MKTSTPPALTVVSLAEWDQDFSQREDTLTIGEHTIPLRATDLVDP